QAVAERLVASQANQWVEPDEAATTLLQALHLLGQLLRLAAIPAIGDHHHHRAASQYAPRPAKVELVQGFADARAAAPVLDVLLHRVQRVVHVFERQRARDARQTRAEQEDFNPVEVETRRDRVHKV